MNPRRKMYWWFVMKGMKYGRAMLAAGYSRGMAGKGRDQSGEAEEGRAVGEYFKAGRLGKGFIEHHLVDLIEGETKGSTKVSALNLAAKITQLIRTGLNINIDQRMPVQVLAIAPPPRWCHKCGALQEAPTLELPPAGHARVALPPVPTHAEAEAVIPIPLSIPAST